ncbi:uncharacterized protein LOC112045830 [Bicyclus anynana]|uniref:Uncharacterized protein LOC112045830 n=1 Tax=Bicyclus anynana TaxID=110368 RepID=A0ABM3LE79_BICAN|nr:uncharacterized protein LOC112045830 [Bicyclus anynana]
MLCLRYCVVVIVQFYLTSAKFFDPEWDMPTEVELNKYLSVVEDTVDYCYRNKNKTDINSAFGLFMAKVNLAHVRRKGRDLPKNMDKRLITLTLKTDEILNVIKRKYEVSRKVRALNLMSLFNNATNWGENLSKFDYTVEMQYPLAQLEEMYSPFNLYLEKADKYFMWVPSPESSDECMESLAKNPTNRSPFSKRCDIRKSCYDIVKRGTDFGYALAHRLLILLAARLGRGCTVFSQHEDRALVKQFCSMAHAEAAYIAENNYGFIDLFMEIIGLCSIDGHAQFLHRIWLDNMMTFQTPDGCFQEVYYKKENIEDIRRSLVWTRVYNFKNILKGGCVEHTTAVAAVAFSAAVRFIVEQYY